MLVVSPSWPAHGDDPAARFVWQHTRALVEAGARVRVLAPGDGPAPEGVERLTVRLRGQLFGQGGAPEALERQPLRAGLAGVGASWVMRRAARAVVEPDERLVAHWLLPSGWVARHVAPRVAHGVAHGGDVALLERLPGGRGIARSIEERLFLTFVSEALRRRFRDLLGRPFQREPHVLPMGVEPARPDPAFVADLKTRAGGRRIVATVGRMVPIKGHDVLADALAGRDDVLWCAAGDGPEAKAIAQRCADQGVPFAALGTLGPGARDGLLAAADLFVLPSRTVGRRTEGTPVALLEALAAGVPVVASDTGGVAAAAGPAGALLVPPEHPVALRAAVDTVLDAAPDAYAARAAQHRAYGARFTWSQIGPRHAAYVLGPPGTLLPRRVA